MKFLKWSAIVIGVILIALFILVKVVSEDRPESTPSKDADAMAESMLDALGKPAWDSLKLLKWTFRGTNHYVWDKQSNIAEISWGENRVLMDLNTLKANAWTNGTTVADQQLNELKDKAWANWCNDSWWMFAPFKAFDPGTTRSIVEDVKHGKYGLMVTYDSGGVTPGDSYLWHLDENYLPIGYKMWVSILPVGGLYFTWEDWKAYEPGVMLASTRKGKIATLDLENVATGSTFRDLGLSEDPFRMK